MVQDFNLTRDEILALKEGDIFKYGGKDVEFISLSYISTKNSNKIWNIRYESVNEPSWGSFDVSDIMNNTNEELDKIQKILKCGFSNKDKAFVNNELDFNKLSEIVYNELKETYN